MISFNELRRGVRVIIDKDPYEILETVHVVKGRGQSVIQAKLKNLKTGNALSKTFRPSDTFEEADVEKQNIKFLYKNKGNCFFCEENNPKNRFELTEENLNSSIRFVKEGGIVEGIFFEDNIIDVVAPIKVELKVVDAPPGIKGDRSQSGNKVIKLETGAEILAPLFIKDGDVVEV
ncbi:MAG: elongation factor P, partial [Candidatus Pacebacteria bacterium]|nr:elongation factor P [Candidatus Paceibacterota bacterium]